MANSRNHIMLNQSCSANIISRAIELSTNYNMLLNVTGTPVGTLTIYVANDSADIFTTFATQAISGPFSQSFSDKNVAYNFLKLGYTGTSNGYLYITLSTTK